MFGMGNFFVVIVIFCVVDFFVGDVMIGCGFGVDFFTAFIFSSSFGGVNFIFGIDVVVVVIFLGVGVFGVGVFFVFCCVCLLLI